MQRMHFAWKDFHPTIPPPPGTQKSRNPFGVDKKRQPSGGEGAERATSTQTASSTSRATCILGPSGEPDVGDTTGPWWRERRLTSSFGNTERWMVSASYSRAEALLVSDSSRMSLPNPIGWYSEAVAPFRRWRLWGGFHFQIERGDGHFLRRVVHGFYGKTLDEFFMQIGIDLFFGDEIATH